MGALSTRGRRVPLKNSGRTLTIYGSPGANVLQTPSSSYSSSTQPTRPLAPRLPLPQHEFLSARHSATRWRCDM